MNANQRYANMVCVMIPSLRQFHESPVASFLVLFDKLDCDCNTLAYGLDAQTFYVSGKRLAVTAQPYLRGVSLLLECFAYFSGSSIKSALNEVLSRVRSHGDASAGVASLLDQYKNMPTTIFLRGLSCKWFDLPNAPGEQILDNNSKLGKLLGRLLNVARLCVYSAGEIPRSSLSNSITLKTEQSEKHQVAKRDINSVSALDLLAEIENGSEESLSFDAAVQFSSALDCFHSLGLLEYSTLEWSKHSRSFLTLQILVDTVDHFSESQVQKRDKDRQRRVEFEQRESRRKLQKCEDFYQRCSRLIDLAGACFEHLDQSRQSIKEEELEEFEGIHRALGAIGESETQANNLLSSLISLAHLFVGSTGQSIDKSYQEGKDSIKIMQRGIHQWAKAHAVGFSETTETVDKKLRRLYDAGELYMLFDEAQNIYSTIEKSYKYVLDTVNSARWDKSLKALKSTKQEYDASCEELSEAVEVSKLDAAVKNAIAMLTKTHEEWCDRVDEERQFHGPSRTVLDEILNDDEEQTASNLSLPIDLERCVAELGGARESVSSLQNRASDDLPSSFSQFSRKCQYVSRLKDFSSEANKTYKHYKSKRGKEYHTYRENLEAFRQNLENLSVIVRHCSRFVSSAKECIFDMLAKVLESSENSSDTTTSVTVDKANYVNYPLGVMTLVAVADLTLLENNAIACALLSCTSFLKEIEEAYFPAKMLDDIYRCTQQQRRATVLDDDRSALKLTLERNVTKARQLNSIERVDMADALPSGRRDQISRALGNLESINSVKDISNISINLACEYLNWSLRMIAKRRHSSVAWDSIKDFNKELSEDLNYSKANDNQILQDAFHSASQLVAILGDCCDIVGLIYGHHGKLKELSEKKIDSASRPSNELLNLHARVVELTRSFDLHIEKGPPTLQILWKLVATSASIYRLQEQHQLTEMKSKVIESMESKVLSKMSEAEKKFDEDWSTSEKMERGVAEELLSEDDVSEMGQLRAKFENVKSLEEEFSANKQTVLRAEEEFAATLREVNSLVTSSTDCVSNKQRLEQANETLQRHLNSLRKASEEVSRLSSQRRLSLNDLKKSLEGWNDNREERRSKMAAKVSVQIRSMERERTTLTDEFGRAYRAENCGSQKRDREPEELPSAEEVDRTRYRGCYGNDPSMSSDNYFDALNIHVENNSDRFRSSPKKLRSQVASLGVPAGEAMV
eukprot:gb/GECG01008740.1/.p1 GENE.gb/GECG01008740.1/~~gb/GECG01008740.1/.p1  ORF type:complete len:1200 (+),score=176.44 gb/GECG01008740.1/:1-3600(+)